MHPLPAARLRPTVRRLSLMVMLASLPSPSSLRLTAGTVRGGPVALYVALKALPPDAIQVAADVAELRLQHRHPLPYVFQGNPHPLGKVVG